MRIFLAAVLASLLLIAALPGCAAPPAAPAAPLAPAAPTSASVGGANIVAISPPAQACCPKQTLPQFLGITGLFHGLQGILGRLRNRLGAIWPGLEAKPALLAITDPANLESGNPAVAAAAGIKSEEDGAAQKAKAIEYLASVGCAGCYPGVEDAMLAALDDCTEAVRFAAAKALRSTASMPCKNCCRSACCGPKLRERLDKMAYGTDSQGCYLESSDRVRRMARLAVCQCTCVPEKPGATDSPSQLPPEGPPEEVPPPAAEAPGVASVLRTPLARQALPASSAETGAASAPIGSGVVPTATTLHSAPTPAAGANATSPVCAINYEAAIAALVQSPAPQDPAVQAASPPAPPVVQVNCEIWTARPGSFASRGEAIALLTVARTQLLSSPPDQMFPPQLERSVRQWIEPREAGSPVLAGALEAIPAGGVSRIIEDNGGWHIVRIVDKRSVPAVVAAAWKRTLQPSPAPPRTAMSAAATATGRTQVATSAASAAASPANCGCR
jgi:hypothetical protein